MNGRGNARILVKSSVMEADLEDPAVLVVSDGSDIARDNRNHFHGLLQLVRTSAALTNLARTNGCGRVVPPSSRVQPGKVSDLIRVVYR